MAAVERNLQGVTVVQETIVVSNFVALTLGMVVYFVGARMTRRRRFLRDYNIPEPVSGGIFTALVIWAIYAFANVEIDFDLSARDTLLVIFFTTIGLNASFSDLIRGGKPLGILLVLTAVFIVVQNVVALVGVSLFGLPSASSVLLGSAALIGGHGTAIAWAPNVAALGVEGAQELGIAAATLGLVLAALVGGPIAKFLIESRNLEPRDPDADPVVGLSHDDESSVRVDYVSFMRALLMINVAIIIGYVVHEQLSAAGLKLPLFVPCLIVGILIANLMAMLAPKAPKVSGTPTLALISEFSLSVFLSMSLMSMKLWTLAGLAGPLFGVLAAQTFAAVAFSIFVLFPLMGGNYRAAVLAAGFGGFTLGATPTAIANMTAVTKRYGPSPMAFIILPLVSAFFVDLANAVVIQFFVAL